MYNVEYIKNMFNISLNFLGMKAKTVDETQYIVSEN